MYTKIQLICHMAIFDCVMCDSFEPLLTIILNDKNQYFKKKITFMSKFSHSAMCHILMDR
jgi:hypothetical protein